MKKIMSLILAVLCITLAALPLSVSAEVAENTKTVYADEVDLGVVKIFSGLQASAPGSDFKLQEDGLLLKAAHSRPVGFMLTPTNYDITALNENYTISVTMTSAHYNGNDEATETIAPNTKNYSWMVFGTGSNTFQAKNEADEWRICSNMVTENGDSTKDPGVKVCYDSASQKYSLAFDGQTAANTAEIAEAILTKSGAVRYDFAFDATAKTMTSVTFTLVSDSSKTATYDFADVAVGEGNFGFALREAYASIKSRFTGVVSELSVKTETETKYSVDFAERYAENCRSTVIGGQLSNDKTTVRILSAITMEDTELANYTSHGFEISLEDSVNGAQTCTSTKVYTSVSAAGDTVTAVDEKCDFIGAMTVTGLAAGESYTFVVRAFVTDAAGNKYMSAAEEITITVPAATPES